MLILLAVSISLIYPERRQKKSWTMFAAGAMFIVALFEIGSIVIRAWLR
ncbi:MAG TPA: hypothetical protein VGH22_21265 [Candidatus Binatia bacterium]|jgi:hypothetical protein